MRNLLDRLKAAGTILDYELAEERRIGPSGPEDVARVTIWVEAARITAAALRQLMDRMAASAREQQCGLIVTVGALLDRREIKPSVAAQNSAAAQEMEIRRG